MNLNNMIEKCITDMDKVDKDIELRKIENILWKKIEEFPKYEVSNFGDIRKKATGKILKGGMSNSGYKNIFISVDGVSKCKLVHRVVLENFIGPAPKGMECDHIDGDKMNNKLSNLRWITHQQNLKLINKSLRKPHGRITQKIADEIRSKHENGISQYELCKEYKFSHYHMYKILHRIAWSGKARKNQRSMT